MASIGQELRPREIPPGVFGVCLGAKSNEKDEVVVEIFVRIEIACIHAVYRMLMKKLEGTIKGQVGVPPSPPHFFGTFFWCHFRCHFGWQFLAKRGVTGRPDSGTPR
jgi:hypothetical protein